MYAIIQKKPFPKHKAVKKVFKNIVFQTEFVHRDNNSLI